MKIPVSEIKKAEAYGPWHNTYMAIYFTLTGLHALHVIGGALVMAYFWIPGSRMWRPAPLRESDGMNSMAAHTAAASHQFAYPVVRPAPRPPVAVSGSSTTW